MPLANIIKRLGVGGISSSNEEATIQFDLRANGSLPVDCRPTRNNPTTSAQADNRPVAAVAEWALWRSSLDVRTRDAPTGMGIP
jgi:hypothetical protein